MWKIIISSLKGGTGKSTVSSNLTRSLKRLGFSVGYLDTDITASIGSEVFGLEKAPDWELDATAEGGKGAIIPYDVDGIKFITLASHFGQTPAVGSFKGHPEGNFTDYCNFCFNLGEQYMLKKATVLKVRHSPA